MSSHVVIPVLISFAVSLVLGPVVIPFLRKLKMKQTERVEGVQSHLKKAGTPTMGGIMILISVIVTSLFYVKDYPKIVPVLFLTVAFGLMKLTNIDLPGEAGTIMHRKEDIGTVELATMTFGQSFQVTPIQMAVTVSSIVNGGNRVTPHVGTAVLDRDGNVVEEFDHEVESGIVSEETSETMRMLLESVVAEGSGKNAYLEGYSIGGKTATSQTLPRSANKYIASFLGFAPADDPQILGMVIIHDPQGVYYGGTIAAPVLRSIYDNVLPYLGIEKK